MTNTQRRDMDLVRQILMDIEAGELHGGVLKARLDEEPRLSHHLKIMADAGLVVLFSGITTGDGVGMFLDRLTWEGHEFLDAVRDDTVWQKVKSRTGQEVASVPFEVVKALAIGFVKEMVSLA